MKKSYQSPKMAIFETENNDILTTSILKSASGMGDIVDCTQWTDSIIFR